MFQDRPVEPDSISLLWRDRLTASAAPSQAFGPHDDLRIQVMAGRDITVSRLFAGNSRHPFDSADRY